MCLGCGMRLLLGVAYRVGLSLSKETTAGALPNFAVPTSDAALLCTLHPGRSRLLKALSVLVRPPEPASPPVPLQMRSEVAFRLQSSGPQRAPLCQAREVFTRSARILTFPRSLSTPFGFQPW